MNRQEKRNIPLAKAVIGEEEENAVLETLRSGWLTHGDKNREFEERFAEYTGVKHAISMNSCASALFIALVANNITGEVILPSFTFSASANAVITAGATPVFADIDYDTGNVDIQSIRKVISSKTEAIMPVHFAGQSAAIDELYELCRTHNLVLIEDSAEAIGAKYNDKKTGSFGIGCFSFFPTKNMTTGEGGMLTTDNDDLAAHIRVQIAHGIQKVGNPPHPGYRSASMPGYNFRMSNLLAAIGLEQLKKLDMFNQRRRELAGLYTSLLGSIEQVKTPIEAEGCYHVYQMYTIKVPARERTPLLRYLQERGIGSSVHFNPPVHLQEYYKQQNYSNAVLTVTEQVSEEILTLPLYPGLQDDDVHFVCDKISEYFS